MLLQTILFYIYALLIIFSAFRVISAKSSVHACLWLILAFFISACMWVLMQADYLGILLVLVYVGAVMVLFLFVVMMLNIDLDEKRAGFWKNISLPFFIGIFTALLMILVLVNPALNLQNIGPLKDLPADYSTVRELGNLLLGTYILPFELAAVLLLLGMIAAIVLVQRKTKKLKYIEPSQQIKAKPETSVRIVDIQAELKQISAVDKEENKDE